MSANRVIIVGGGFGGVKCAKAICRRAKDAEVVLFNKENHLVFSPLLTEVVGSSIDALDVVVPLRQLLPQVSCRTEEVRKIHLESSEIEYLGEDGQGARMRYEHLVLACGNVTNLNVVPGMSDHAFPLKSVGDAAHLRSHIMERMEQAEVAADEARRRWHLTFLVVGGGFSGVEAAGEINDLVRGSAKYFRLWTAADVTVALVHGGSEILPEISPGLREFARRRMERAGVTMRLGARVASATPEGVGLEGGGFLRGGTIVCTIGNSVAELTRALESPKEHGRLVTDPDLRLAGRKNVWAIGDCAWVINALDGKVSPTTGQFAERQGTQCGLNLARTLRGQPTLPFCYRPLGELCSIGGHSAVADLFGLHLSGFFAWFVWRGVYLFKLPTFGRKLQVGFDWATLLAFPRDLAHVRTTQTDRVSHAHFDAGEFIIRKGEPPTYFYVLEKGEVEVLRPNDGAPAEVVAVLGSRSFFGERALMGDRPRVMSVRARTPVEVLMMGRNVFTQFSGALAPLRNALAQTLNRRSLDIWKDRPQVYDLLRRKSVRDLMETAPQPFLKPEATLWEVSHHFVVTHQEFFYVCADGRNLDGVVTITDIVRAEPTLTSPETRVRDFMTRNPVTVAASDTCDVAAAVLREYRLKNLPVVAAPDSREVVGCLKVRRLIACVLKELAERDRNL